MPRPIPVEFNDPMFTFLEPHMWVMNWRYNHMLNGVTAEIGGLLKPQPNEGGGRVVRRMFMDVLDQALDAITEAGILHVRHPSVRIDGDSLHSFDKPDDFDNVRCEVEFHLAVRI